MATGGNVARATAALIAMVIACGRGGENTRARALDEIVVRATAYAPELNARLGRGFARDGASFVSLGFRGSRAGGTFTPGDLGVRVAEHGDGALDVGLGRFPSLRFGVKLEDAAPVGAELRDGRVVYAGVREDTDRVLAATATALEELLVLYSSRAPASFAWHVDTRDGTLSASPYHGGLAFRDATGAAKILIAEPWLVDARGEKRAAPLQWDEARSTMRVTVDARDLTYPVVLDPAYTSFIWERQTAPARPNGRGEHALAYDAVRQRVVMFGGRDLTTNADLADTWLWSGGQWTRATPAASPSGRTGSSMAFHAASGKVVLFGGFALGLGPLSDTWLWDGSTWTQTGGPGPSARSGAAMAEDPARGEVLLVGGNVTSVPQPTVSDTWVWNGASWTLRTPAQSPSARGGAALARDRNGNMVLYGGSPFGGGASSDTYTWNGINWTSLSLPTTPGPQLGAFAYDETSTNTFFLPSQGSDAWLWTGAAWLRATGDVPAFRNVETRLAYDRARASIFAYDGSNQAAHLGNRWLEPSAPTKASNGLAYDEARGKIVLFGSDTPPVTFLGDGAQFTISPALGPTTRYGGSMAYDSARSAVVMFGGASSGASDFGGTWRWTGSWSLAATIGPTDRRGSAMAFDVRAGEVVLFGGTVGSAQNAETWLWNGTTWRRAMPTRAPTARAGHAMAYDAPHQRVVLFGGYDTTLAGDTWTWDGADWTQQTPAHAPTARTGPAMALDGSRGQIVLFGSQGGGASPGTGLNDGWVWDGADWSATTAASGPTSVDSPALVYHAGIARLVLYGAFTAPAQTWQAYTLGGGCASASDCPGGSFCVDAACCKQPSCGTCSTCAGATPGTCNPVRDAEDPDSCGAAAGSSCNVDGLCRKKNGQPAVSETECVSGHAADGVCCDVACDGPCLSCVASQKESGMQSGVCGPSTRGSNPRARCVAEDGTTCGRSGTCDGQGQCALRTVGAACGGVTCVDNRAAGRICDGFGACRASATGAACGAYACASDLGCLSACAQAADCAPLYVCSGGRCVPDQAAVCDGDHNVRAPNGVATDCTPFRCAVSTCKTKCLDVTDCVYPAQCDESGRCVDFDPAMTTGGDGCACNTAPAPGSALAWLTVIAFLANAARRRATPRRGAEAFALHATGQRLTSLAAMKF